MLQPIYLARLRGLPTELCSLFLAGGGSRLVDDISSSRICLISSDVVTVNDMLTAKGKTVGDFGHHRELVNDGSASTANEFAVFFDTLFLVTIRIRTFLRLGFFQLWRWTRLWIFNTVEPLDWPLRPPWRLPNWDCCRHGFEVE